MRRPADLNAQIKAIQDDAKSLKKRQTMQLSEPVLAPGADFLWNRSSASCSLRSNNPMKKPTPSRDRPKAAPPSFMETEAGAGGETATRVSRLRNLQMTARLLRRAAVQRNRLDAQRGRTNMRRANAHPERTRHLMERGGLVQRARVVELRGDGATLLGAWLPIADTFHGAEDAGDDRHHIVTRWQHRAFDADRAALSP